jgi:hypothetical protein
MGMGQIQRALSQPKEKIESILRAFLKEGFLEKKGGVFLLKK